jgi:hypothetical protein
MGWRIAISFFLDYRKFYNSTLVRAIFYIIRKLATPSPSLSFYVDHSMYHNRQSGYDALGENLYARLIGA